MPNVVKIHYTLTNQKGELLDSSRDGSPFVYMEGIGAIIPGLEKELKSWSVGTRRTVVIKSQEAYGEKKSELVVKASRSQFPADTKLNVGDRFRGGPDSHSPVFLVTEVSGDSITLDGNHELAGQDLTFDVELLGQRPASEEEVSHGHVHGEGGHHH
jgi:FKBP-type peptidyl-prolyl cis-trans isomerase SlyD